MTTKQQVEKANEAACISVALHERSTQRPWSVLMNENIVADSQHDPEQWETVAQKLKPADAAFIVQCVNLFDELKGMVAVGISCRCDFEVTKSYHVGKEVYGRGKTLKQCSRCELLERASNV